MPGYTTALNVAQRVGNPEKVCGGRARQHKGAWVVPVVSIVNGGGSGAGGIGRHRPSYIEVAHNVRALRAGVAVAEPTKIIANIRGIRHPGVHLRHEPPLPPRNPGIFMEGQVVKNICRKDLRHVKRRDSDVIQML